MSNGRRLWPGQNRPIINRSIFHTLCVIMDSAGLLMFPSSVTLSAPQVHRCSQGSQCLRCYIQIQFSNRTPPQQPNFAGSNHEQRPPLAGAELADHQSFNLSYPAYDYGLGRPADVSKFDYSSLCATKVYIDVGHMFGLWTPPDGCVSKSAEMVTRETLLIKLETKWRECVEQQLSV